MKTLEKMAAKKQRNDAKSRRRILELLKVQGALDAQTIAEEIGTSAMAVRQHLYALQDERLVTFREESRPVGRPAKLWQLTSDADQFFPDAHATLAQELIGSLSKTFRAAGLDKLMPSARKSKLPAT